MKLRHASVLFGLFLIVTGVSFTGCADDDDSTGTEVDCVETPDDPACETGVDCKETPEAPECLVRSEVDKYNVRRCPELEDDANEVLHYNEGFASSRNLGRMVHRYNKSYGVDTLVHPGETQRIEGRFWSGNNNAPGIGSGPEGEGVVVFRKSDDAWEVLGEGVTDKDGKYEVDVPAGEEFVRGNHRILSVLKADGTCVEHGVFVYEKEFETILTDIDATLTTLDDEMMYQMFNDLEYVPKMLIKADEMTNLWDQKGYLMLYLSARPYDYMSWTRIWLREEGFPFGAAQGATGFVHGNSAATYKEAYARRIMEDLEWKILYAYGNAFSDVDGYVNAGIPKENCFMVNEAGCPSEENAATPERTDAECTCYVGSTKDGCDKFDDLQETPYIDQEGVAYRETVEISPNDSYVEHIADFVTGHASSSTPK